MKVIITTSGQGSRLNVLTKHTNKSLIKLGDKFAICYIIESYPVKTEFIITIGYKGKLVKDFLELAYPDHTFIFVEIDKFEGDGSSLGYSLYQTRKYIDSPFFFHCCDCILENTFKIINNFDENIIYSYASNKIESNNYATITNKQEYVLSINDKNADKYDSIYIGLSFIKDYKLFFEILEKILISNEYGTSLSDIHIMRQMLNNNINFKNIKVNKWIDIGDINIISKYENTFRCKYEVLHKNNESICFVNNRVIKFFIDKNRVSDRFKRGKLFGDLVPTLYDKRDNFFSMELIDGYVLTKSYNSNEILNLLDWAMNTLWIKKNNNDIKKTCYEFYITKTLQRVELFKKKYGDYNNITYINGIKIKKIECILDGITDILINENQSYQFHGDFILENIIKVNSGYKLIDWRERFGDNLVDGDIYYDLAKLRHNLYVNHENILNKLYNVTIVDDNVYIDLKCNYKNIIQIQDFDNFILKHNLNLEKIKLLTSLIWINMSPLHDKEFGIFLYFFGLYNINICYK
jgi:NDP-sugar pyrophosphorylase family protein